MEQELSYGPVLVVKGKYKDTWGFYDDDEGNKAVVYFGRPCCSDYVMIPHNYLEGNWIQ